MNLIKKLFLVVFVTLGCQISFAQKQAAIWYFGSNTGLDFNSGPSKLTTTLLPIADDNEGEGFSTISDDNGNLLFHTNGENIWDKNLAIMQNGSGLGGHYSATQCATVFPVPGQTVASNKARYVVVTSPFSQDVSTPGKTGIRYSIVAMDSAAYPTGAVTNVKNLLVNGSPLYVSEALASCPHYNGTDVWVVAHTKLDGSGLNGNRFYAWKFSANGTGNVTITGPIISTIGAPLTAPNWSTSAGIAVLKINSCFNKIALSHYGNSVVQVFSFNNNSGVVGNYPAPINAPLQLDLSKTISGNTGDTQNNYGLEFSPSGQYLFATQTGEGTSKKRIYRFDLSAGTQTDIENSRYTVYSEDADAANNHRLGHLQLGIDGKIYATHFYRTTGTGTSRIDVINTPNDVNPGFASSVYTWTSAQRTSMGLPTFHKGFLAGRTSITSSINNLEKICLGDGIDLTALSPSIITSYKWNIDKNLNSTIDYTTGPTINHTYDAIGSYQVELSVVDNCGYTYTSESTVIVNPIVNTQATFTCGDPNLTVEVVSPVPGATYVWYKDAAGKNPIGTGTSLTFPKTYKSAFYVKQAVSPSASTASGTIGNSYVNGSIITTSAANKMSDTLYVYSSVYLKTAQIDLQQGTWDDPTLKNYVVTLKQGTTTIATLTPSITVVLNNTPNILTVTFNQNLAPGIYTIEVYTTTPPASNNYQRITSKSSLTPSSISGLAEVKNGPTGSPFYNFVFDYPTLAICSRLSDGMSIDCILPVDFLSINVTPERVITWSTATETNNNYFVVERSYDGFTFEAIGTVKGAGNSTSIRTYSFVDQNNLSEEAYYRIKQVDTDEKYSYSSVVYVGKSDDLLVSVYPNPNNGQFAVRISNSQNSTIELFNMIGNVVYNTSAREGQSLTNIDISTMAKGAYFLKVTTDTQSSVTKVIIE